MSGATEQRLKEVTEAAVEFLNESEPVILTVSGLADRVGVRVGVSQGTAKKYLRIACEKGDLLELEPSPRFYVEMTGSQAAGFGHTIRVVEKYDHIDWSRKLVLSTDKNAAAPSSYGPGNTTYMITADYGKRYLDELITAKKAEDEAKAAQRKEEKAAERREITSRYPGLITLTRRLTFILEADVESRGRARAWLHEPPLSGYEDRPKVPIEDWDLHLDLSASNDMIPRLRTIIESGLATWLESQPDVRCVHCVERILQLPSGIWWHVLSTRDKCKVGGTEATPPESS